MKKLYRNCFVCLFVCLFSINLYAKEVNKQTAEKVAINAFAQLDNNKNISGFQVKEILTVKSEEKTSFYIINFKPTGFIIISASDATIPILGSSAKSTFSLENLPPQLSYLLENFKSQIKEIEKLKIEPTNEIKDKWDKYTKTEFSGTASTTLKSATTASVAPLLSTAWDQSYPWNQHCPVNSDCPGGYCFVGCSGVALAQVLYYWGCRVNESGTIVDSNYNNLSVDLTSENYMWNSIDEAKLLYHCALATQTTFGADGSEGFSYSGMGALVSNYGFKNTIGQDFSALNSPSVWISKIENELNQGRPIIYVGRDNTEKVSHAWVIDGYNTAGLVHCNWGWGGYLDDYFPINDLSPAYYNFSSSQWAIMGIEPVMPNCEEINGGPAICSSGTSFNVPTSSLPSGATVTWEKSDNITIVSSQPANPCTFQANGTDSGWIEATVHSNGSSATLDRKEVWLGPPMVPVFEASETINCDGSFYDIMEDNLQTVSWDVTLPLYIFGGSVGKKCRVYASGNGYAGPAWITATAENNCGSESTVAEIYIECPEQYELLLAPNPAANEVEVSFKSKTLDQLQSMPTPDKQLNVKIYNNQGNIIQNTKMAGNKFKLSTSSLKDGSYIVEVEIDKKLYSKKLLVKH